MRYLIKVHQSYIIKNHKIVYLTWYSRWYQQKQSITFIKKEGKAIKTEALTKSMNVYIWTIGTLKQLFIRGSSAQIKLLKQ